MLLARTFQFHFFAAQVLLDPGELFLEICDLCLSTRGFSLCNTLGFFQFGDAGTLHSHTPLQRRDLLPQLVEFGGFCFADGLFLLLETFDLDVFGPDLVFQFMNALRELTRALLETPLALSELVHTLELNIFLSQFVFEDCNLPLRFVCSSRGLSGRFFGLCVRRRRISTSLIAASTAKNLSLELSYKPVLFLDETGFLFEFDLPPTELRSHVSQFIVAGLQRFPNVTSAPHFL
mmetsp:Transcript_74291/g.174395  ORF Transcript_74291/g.174395 Transcript_74291/m.174395 type:complete len:234 (+) Transcript_74291:1854-2555(+)